MISRLPPAAGIMFAFVIFFGYISPTYSGSITELRASIDRAQAALDAAKDFSQKQDELAAAKNAIAPENLARIEDMLPDSVDNVGVIIDLTSLTTTSGVQLTNINAPPPPKSFDETIALATVGSIDLTLSVNGSYEAFQRFLAGIEHSARLLDVIGLTVHGSDTGVYSYDMVIRLYWLR